MKLRGARAGSAKDERGERGVKRYVLSTAGKDKGGVTGASALCKEQQLPVRRQLGHLALEVREQSGEGRPIGVGLSGRAPSVAEHDHRPVAELKDAHRLLG